MLIPITRKPSENPYKLPPQLAKLGNDEIVLIELQGSLDVEGTPDGELVGTLEIDPKTDKPTLLIGHHLLEGKIASLTQPLAVLEKSGPRKRDSEDVEESCNESQAGWNIAAVVKRKIVFGKRPMPVLSTNRLSGLDRT